MYDTRSLEFIKNNGKFEAEWYKPHPHFLFNRIN